MAPYNLLPHKYTENVSVNGRLGHHFDLLPEALRSKGHQAHLLGAVALPEVDPRPRRQGLGLSARGLSASTGEVPLRSGAL